MHIYMYIYIYIYISPRIGPETELKRTTSSIHEIPWGPLDVLMESVWFRVDYVHGPLIVDFRGPGVAMDSRKWPLLRQTMFAIEGGGTANGGSTLNKQNKFHGRGAFVEESPLLRLAPCMAVA